MNKYHLFWIIPLTILITLVIIHPSLNNKAIGWSPIDENDVICNNKTDTFSIIKLSNCSNGKEYNSLMVKERIFEGYTLTERIYCKNIIEEKITETTQ